MSNKRKTFILQTQADRDLRTRQLINSSFDDYISSRFLLINSYPLNGLILGSMAVEKYLKAILVHLTGEVKAIHFDNIPEIQADFDNTAYKDIFKLVDPKFIELLSCGYQLRYYDNLKKPITVGFVTNQALAEIDLFIAHLDRVLTYDTAFKQAQKEQDKRVCDLNYLAHHWDKKEFCERECQCHAIYVDPSEPDPIRINSIKGIITPYHGFLTSFNVKKEKVESL